MFTVYKFHCIRKFNNSIDGNFNYAKDVVGCEYGQNTKVRELSELKSGYRLISK